AGICSHPGRVLLRLRCRFDFTGVIGLNCRSTAPGAKRTGICSHPGRVLLRLRCRVRFYPRWLGSIVGAPPRCEAARHLFAPGAGAPTAKVQGSILPRWLGPIVGAPPPARSGPAFVRTRGGCSYGEGAEFDFTEVVVLDCRSTAPGANGAGNYSHPGRVLLRLGWQAIYEGVVGPDCRSTASVRTGRAPVRTGAGTAVPPVQSSSPSFFNR